MAFWKDLLKIAFGLLSLENFVVNILFLDPVGLREDFLESGYFSKFFVLENEAIFSLFQTIKNDDVADEVFDHPRPWIFWVEAGVTDVESKVDSRRSASGTRFPILPGSYRRLSTSLSPSS